MNEEVSWTDIRKYIKESHQIYTIRKDELNEFFRIVVTTLVATLIIIRFLSSTPLKLMLILQLFVVLI